jgi:hypothetical protein
VLGFHTASPHSQGGELILKSDAPFRGPTDVGIGDFVKIGAQWKRIKSNTAIGDSHPRTWVIRTEDGLRYGPVNINRYAKAEDLE